MASLFPSGIDTFTNPVYSKVDGEDVVNAAHVNDLQDAVRSIQEVVAGAGKTLDMTSNRYIADDSSFKAMVEALDAGTGSVSDVLAEHMTLALLTDAAQHHANVIDVTSLGNLSSSRVQPALEEHQSDIDAIMSGGTVEGNTLDDRYVLKAGAQEMQGPLTITDALIVNGNVLLGDAAGDTVGVADVLTVGGTLEVGDTTTLNEDLLVQVDKKIAEAGATDASYILFGSDKLEFYSHKDIVFRLDADDATDGLSDAGQFLLMNGLNAQILSVDETGNLVLAGDIASANSVTANTITIGDLDITSGKLDFTSDSLHIQLDKGDGSAAGRFFITMDGDTGSNLASPDLLINVDETSTLVTGIHKLKSGIQETGYFGLRIMSANAGGEFHGAGINFKTVLTNAPSSVTLSVDAGSVNHSNLSVVDMNQYGFFFEFDTPAVGAAKVFGTYTTVGN